MENQTQLIAKITNIISFIKKYHGQNRLSYTTFSDQGPDTPPVECAICLNDICRDDMFRKLPQCAHCFHVHCIDTWFKSRSTCPLCRVEIPEIIHLIEDQCQWTVVLSKVLSLFQDFLERICNPLNEELTSMLNGNVKYTLS